MGSDSDVGGMGDAAGRSRTIVQSLQRGLSVIKAFDAEHSELTLSEVARLTSLTRATARRVLITLEDMGYVKSQGKRFSLNAKILELGYAYLSEIRLPEIAAPHMEALVAKTHESCSMAVLDGPDIVYVARVPTRRIMVASITVGTRLPAYVTSMGRVLLGHLDEMELDNYLENATLRSYTPMTLTDRGGLRDTISVTREQGYAFVDEELEIGLRTIAVPVHSNGKVVAAMNIAMMAARVDAPTAHSTLLPALRETVEAIEADMAASPLIHHS